eukprot:CAMPEP_0201491330 /NCGR_PEP_ID=MMETSP0151_2-20130828/29415_1 /ASSEMBLY_ACC=CAM_ASM_000257 /TAXON_ID=200890 /ORGANISM="Paramoeba atlantica, Strain 621/1 / CCAP 1560/9" /LENGTH=249 /DNA_ID=CAMNT_0047877631 /DNA_START=231 /DNA_END=980 /DNA_ORIENTATION=-
MISEREEGKKNAIYRKVLCPDVVGRGKSDWLKNETEYGYPLYCSSIGSLLSTACLPQSPSRTPQIDFVGTSMGGIIGMMLASLENSPIRKLVINDIGAVVELESLIRIATYTTKPPPVFDSLSEAVDYFMNVHSSFGLSRSKWEQLVPHGTKKVEGTDRLTLSYDPGIVHMMRNISELKQVELWNVWEKIKCPVMIVHGEQSDLLSVKTLEEMKKRNPCLVRVYTVKGVGHAPGLVGDQIDPIIEFLRE